MDTEVIIHNSVSLDHAVTGFDIDLGLHYGTLLAFLPDALLAGSTTAKSGIEMFMDITQPEHDADRRRPEISPDDRRPIGVIVDSRGILMNLLHFYRNLEHIRDVIVLVSETTPEEYLDYLKEREYPYIRCGRDRVNIRGALHELKDRFSISRIVSDSGSDLNNVLIREGIADILSLVVYPVIAGRPGKKLFDAAGSGVTLKLLKAVSVEQGRVQLVYAIGK